MASNGVSYNFPNSPWLGEGYSPSSPESDEITPLQTTTDIVDRERTKEQIRNEILVLREKLDCSSIFEEIVGSSKAIHQLLKQVEKVAEGSRTPASVPAIRAVYPERK